MSVRQFVDQHYRHFNAGELARAAHSLTQFLSGGGKIFLTLAGAMSTAELGRSLAPMIRAGHIAGISCTGANLEEDLFNLVAHNSYVSIENWRNLSAEDDAELLRQNLNRVTDICIPEEEAFRKIEHHIVSCWKEADASNISKLPHEFFYQLLTSKVLEPAYEANPDDSWLLAAAQNNLPLYVPGWEDSTLGNIFAAHCIEGEIRSTTLKNGIEYMIQLAQWYESRTDSLAFLQIGGGIAGDFPICVVPLLHQDLERKVPLWSWYCQISESSPSYGGYSGAPPNEKITWGKLAVETPKFVIESDATIVAPLLFGYVLDL
ncbi:MAG: deoxyhypusine synthase family protein [Candidatus Poseidoniaceae archaeon]|nr:deoxyhypusine synthase family protein [Candidatus Poseidoniaceae archaeon]|tara:strand:- start:3233 stop:4189 length:957 start_codon:yes stop_codon:yes gene_type:complete